MESKVKNNLGYLIVIALFIKLLALGLTYTDCLGALVLLSFAFGSMVLEYFVPKRPDLYAITESMQAKINELVSKNEGLERDVTGLKIERIRR